MQEKRALNARFFVSHYLETPARTAISSAVTETEFEVVPVADWIAEDDLLTPQNVVMDLK